MTAVLLLALIAKVVDFLRLLTNLRTQKSAVLTQLTAWIGGVAIVALASNASIAKGIVVPGFNQALGNLDFGSTILVGLAISSLASLTVDFKQGIDRSDSAAKPPLLGETPAPPTAAVHSAS